MGRMTLAEYLRTHDLKAAEFARRVGVSRQNISRWSLGQVLPRPEEMKRIQEATGGQVMPNDFFAAPSREVA